MKIIVVGIVVLFQIGYSYSCQTPGISVEEKSDHSDHSDHTHYRSIAKDFGSTPGLESGDIVEIHGHFRSSPASIRFYNKASSCSAENGQCQPLIIKFYPSQHMMKVFDLVGESSDHYITSVTSDMIATHKNYELQIVVVDKSYELIMNDQLLAKVQSRLGSDYIQFIRLHGGYFDDFHIEHEHAGTIDTSTTSSVIAN